MQRIRQDWEQVPLIEQPQGRLQRPISMLSRQLEARSVVPAHSHNWGQLVYSYNGVLEVATPSGRYLVPQDRAVWVPPNEPHEVSSLYGARISSIYIAVEEGAALPVACCVLEVSALLRELIIEALRLPPEYEWKGAPGRLLRTVRDQVAVANPAPLYLPLPGDPRLRKICDQLQIDPGNKYSLEQFGAQVGASARTLQRLFLKETGMGFQAWRQQLRIQQAVQRLVEGNDSITRIALDLGYESNSAFIAMFQKQTGETPGEYMKRLRKHA